MYQRYHRSITEQALAVSFSPTALQVIVQANIHQDRPAGQIGHAEYHFDNSAITQGQAYIDHQRQVTCEKLSAGQARPAWQAFGRLVHAAQDFYAHTSYVRLWLDQHEQAPPAEIDPFDAQLVAHPGLVSGRNYLVLEIIALLPGLHGMIQHLSPHDSHLRLNLDGPERGPLFPYVMAAAEKRTTWEYQHLLSVLSASQARLFHDH